MLNCVVDLAENDHQALECIAKKNYDLIFLDIGLPDLNGCEIARKIRHNDHNLNQNTIIIGLITHVSIEDQLVCLAAGMQRVLTKPLQMEQVREVISRYVGRHCQYLYSEELTDLQQ